MAAAGTITIAEVEEIGEIDSAYIQTPGVYVDRLVEGIKEKRIEKKTIQKVG